MKSILSKLSLFFVFLFFSSHVMAAETYELDNQHSYVAWQVSHFDYSHPSGKWMVDGTLVLDAQKPQNSKVSTTIHIADLITGIKKLDEHLMGEMFFDVKKYPTATFVSNKVDLIDKTSANVQGILTLRGVSKPVTLHVKLNKQGISPITDKQTAGFTAHTTIKRSDFGMTSFLPGVGDEVTIHIEAEAIAKQEKVTHVAQ